jgi:NTE family protein
MQMSNLLAAHAPRLALVLGSGGVRSIAALGVADVLAGAGLKPDLVVGCSSGALFGACVAMGLSGAQGLEAATSLWSRELTEKKRWRAYLEMLAPRLMGFDAGFSLRDARLIRERVELAFGNALLQQLPTALRIVATEVSSGESMVLTQGSVADAVLASMALPLIFPSVSFAGHQLVDGVLSDPLPVSAARDAHAIVTLGFRGALPRRIDRPARLIGQVTTTMINNLQQARLGAARASGQRMLHLDVDIDRRVGLWDTAAMPRIYELGRRTAEVQLPAIRQMLGLPLAA